MRPVFFDFTSVYEKQEMSEHGDVIDMKDLDGTRMYVDDAAEEEIRHRIAAANTAELSSVSCPLRFLDNGNYHYMTRILASLITEPFDLITFDHHTDDQPPAFEGAKSCGSWRLDITKENKYLRQSLLIQRYDDYDTVYTLSELPLYISIDKDILSTDVLHTNWDQGDMSREQLFDLLQRLKDTRKILAVDVCGEDLPDNPCDQNKDFNLSIIHLLSAPYERNL
jgi:hypothetical protein